MLTAEQIEINKSRYLQLISTIEIEGADTQGLVDYLLSSDFFTAPASTLYHSNYEGGLCQHSLNVYDALCNLANMYAPNKYDYSSLVVVALLHDLAKVNFYEKYIMNKKHYHPAGTKHDNQGNFDWIAEEAFKVRDAKERFLGGEHGFNSMIIANRYIPMTYEETLAILHHHCGQGESKQLTDLSAILNKYPLVTLLHMADFISTFITEVC